MKRSAQGTPYLSWCIISRNSETTVEATLKSLRERTPNAEIVVVDTCSRDSSPEIVQRYADVYEVYRGPRGDWDEDMPWFDDAAAARQRAFELASGTWRGWIDTDDRLAGPEEAERLLRLNKSFCPPVPRGKVVGNSSEVMTLEDTLHLLEKRHPEADCVWAPYLYRRDGDGHALIWQERERIVRWDPTRWRWAERAHEILVPIKHVPPHVVFSHLLYVHEKKFSTEDATYALSRHFDVLSREYEDGRRTTRTCTYLAEYAQVLCPGRTLEFIEAAHAAATTVTDRYRSLVQKGAWYADRGLFNDALEAFGAAVYLRGDLPDAWLAGAGVWSKANDQIRSVDWYEKAFACKADQAESYISPRDFAMKFPTLLSIELQKLGDLQVAVGQHEGALQAYDRAVQWTNKVATDPDVGEDGLEARARLIRAIDKYRAQQQAIGLRDAAQYLFDSDEPLKVAALAKAVPWTLQDHPIVVEIERRLRPVLRHVFDPKAYSKFYQDNDATGAIETPETWLEPENAQPRVRWLADWIKEHNPRARVLEVGPFDGIVGIPLLRACPNITYVGLDVGAEVVGRFRERLQRFGLADRAQVIEGTIDTIEIRGRFDVVVWFEVIEHVPDPEEQIQRLQRYLAPNGRLFVTTPWGAFDKSRPPPTNAYGKPRDPRGHVRAMTPRDVVEVVRDRRLDERYSRLPLRIVDLHKASVAPRATGDCMNIELRKTSAPFAGDPVSFVVPGALWHWNSRTVHAEGMGASEETIVYLAKRLATGNLHSVEVFGPVPDNEGDVHHEVPYWPSAQLRHVTAGKLVVSRAPAHAKYLDEFMAAKLPKVLWLQDAWYPELNEEIAQLYERIVVVSEWHKQAMHERHDVPLDLMQVIYNFLIPEHFLPASRPKRKRDHFIYASSPDRGIVRLLELWPEILKRLPEATLDIFYGWRGCEVLGASGGDAWGAKFEKHRKRFETLLHQKGVRQMGMVDHVTLANAFMSSGVWAYFTDFEETCCTNSVKARAAGAIPVCPPLAALAETARCDAGIFVDPNDTTAFVEACVRATEVDDTARARMSEEAIETYALDTMLPRWLEVLK